VPVDWRADLTEETGEGEAILLANPDRVAALAERAGISDGTTVVVYDDSQAVFAARAWWSLRAYGLESVRILDGGYPAWVSEGRPITNAESNRCRRASPSRVEPDAADNG
jgi:thiosulfate/3-mercaptopyruvate sulfurtransferase